MQTAEDLARLQSTSIENLVFESVAGSSRRLARRRTYADASPSIRINFAVDGPSIRVKPGPAPHAVGSVFGAHWTKYVVVDWCYEDGIILAMNPFGQECRGK